MKNRKLKINKTEAALVRHIFKRFVQIGSATELVKELATDGHHTKSWTTQKGRVHEGRPINKGFLYKLLKNPLYIGMAVHKSKSYPGEHKPIIDQSLWDKAQTIFAENSRSRGNRTRASTPAPLKGIIRCKNCNCAMTPSHTRKKNGRLYRYYVCMSAIKNGHDTCKVKSVAAGDAEEAVINQVRALIRSPEIIARTWKQVKKHQPDIRESDIIDALLKLDPVWSELFPGEQARILALLVESVDVSLDGLAIKLRTEGLERLVGELGGQPRKPEGVA